MVSLSRLLAAADDPSSDEPAATSLLTRPLRDCVLPPFLPSDSIPSRLRLNQGLRRTAPPNQQLPLNAASESFRPSPLLPLQRLLRDLGPQATSPANMATLARTLAHFGRPSEAAVASALLFLTTHIPSDSTAIDSHTMFHLFALFCGDPDNSSIDPIVQQAVATSTNSPLDWRADMLVQAVSSIAAQFKAPLDWRLVIHSLDVEGLETQLTQAAFVEIAKAYIAGTGGSFIPADCILDSWRYNPAQLCMISHALASPECVNWDVLDIFQGATAEDVISPYSRVLLIEKLVELDARDLLQYAIKENSNAVLLSLACGKPRNNNALQQNLTVTLLAPLFAVFPTSEKPLRQMWNVSPRLVEAGIVSMWKKDSTTLRTALSISLDMHILPDLLASSMSVDFSLELALLAFQGDVLKFEGWLLEFLSTRGALAASRIVVFIAHKARIDPIAAGRIPVDSVRIILRCLIGWARRSRANQGKEFVEGVQDLYDIYCRLDPRIADLAPSADIGNAKVTIGSEIPAPSPPPVQSDAASTAAAMLLPIPSGQNGGSTAFPSSIEEETGVFFQRLYQGELLTEQAVDILRRVKASGTEKDSQVFNCMLHTLFDEYRFFKNYPDRQLKITGIMFGSIIQYSLVSGGLLGLAARCILDALRTVEPAPHPVGRLAKFGLCALERFKNRLHEWPQFCSQVLELVRLKEIAPGLIGEVQQALDINGAVIPSAAEKKIGLAEVDRQTINEPIHSADGGAPPASSLRDAAADADAVRVLVASPPLSTNNTPVKGRSISSTSLRASSTANMDSSLGLSPLDLSNLLGMSPEEANQVIVPDEITQDKTKFIFNNLSQAMMDEKVEEMLAILKPEYFHFFAVYIVVKRASSEANFHHLYIDLLERISERTTTLLPLVCQTTYRRVNVLLSVDRSRTSAYRGILKSLGSWIGSLTLARNIPILKRELDLKEALLHAYSNGRLTTVMPFVAKVLEACQDSKIFKPTNPWVRGVLSLMKEIYSLDDLKLNMKFELQILSKHIVIDVNSIVPSDLLRLRIAPDKIQNPDFATKKAISSPPQTSPSPTASSSPEARRTFAPAAIGARPSGAIFTLSEQRDVLASLSKPLPSAASSSTGRIEINQGLLPGNVGGVVHDSVGDLTSMLHTASLSSSVMGSTQSQRNHTPSQSTVGVGAIPPSNSHRTGPSVSAPDLLLPNLSQIVTVSPSLGLLNNAPNLKRLIPLAIDRAIREIIQPVVDRSCAIAFLTTKELTSKDFANEHDITKVRRAAMQMVQQLAGSLALVTSKEPLRVSMGNQLRTILTPSVVSDQNMIEQTAQVICNANLEIGCAIIERYAKERAARDLNENSGSAFVNRRQQSSSYTYGMLPGPDLYRVYDEFSRIHRSGVVSPSYSSQIPRSSHSFPSGNQTHVSISPDSTQMPPNFTPSVPTHGQLSEQRANGTGLDPRPIQRAANVQPPPRVIGNSVSRADFPRNTLPMERKLTSATTLGNEPYSKSWVSGPSLPKMASRGALTTLLLQACGSSNANEYSEHASNIPGSSGSTSGEMELSTQEVLERFNSIYPQLIANIDASVSASGGQDLKVDDLTSSNEIHTLWVQIPAAVRRANTIDEACMAVAQKVFKRLFEGPSRIYREIHVLILEGLRETCRRLSKELASWLAFSEERKKLHPQCIIALLRPGSLLCKTSYDEILSKTIDSGRNSAALDFACFLIRKAIIEEPLATAGDFYLTLEVIVKVARRQGAGSMPIVPGELLALVESARSTPHDQNIPTQTTNTDTHPTGTSNGKDSDADDPSGAKEFVAQVLLNWHSVLIADSNRSTSDHSVSNFIRQIRGNSLFNEESGERFFRIAVELVYHVTLLALESRGAESIVPSEMAESPYSAVDNLVRLVVALSRTEVVTIPVSSCRLLSLFHFVIALAKSMLRRSFRIDIRPYSRLLMGVMKEFSTGSGLQERSNAPDVDINPGSVASAFPCKLEEISSSSEAMQFLDDKDNGMLLWLKKLGNPTCVAQDISLGNFQVQGAIVGALSMCAPDRIPRFAFNWLELLSNKEFFPNLLSPRNVDGWPMFRHLLLSFLSFISGLLDNAEEPLGLAVRTLYNGLLRVLLVLLHDFPEFLCAYHMDFCQVIPDSCVQLRNLILSSFPKQMRLPDPFSPDLNVRELPEMSRNPLILSNIAAPLQMSGMKSALDACLTTHERFGIRPKFNDLVKCLCTITENAQSVYQVAVFDSMMICLAQDATSRKDDGEGLETPSTEIIRFLTSQLDFRGQTLLFNALTNQLRFPNSHTMYFSNVILMLFRESGNDCIKEEIAKVLVERLIANRPHPWGLLITFVELLKNPEYKFWSYPFVTCAPEIEQLFKNVSTYCMAPSFQSRRQSLVSAK